jgi:hypothetical protein
MLHRCNWSRRARLAQAVPLAKSRLDLQCCTPKIAGTAMLVVLGVLP